MDISVDTPYQHIVVLIMATRNFKIQLNSSFLFEKILFYALSEGKLV